MAGYNKKLYDARWALGQCTRCGKQANDGRSKCLQCLQKDKLIHKKDRQDKPSKPYNKNRYRDWRYKKVYGMTLVEYNRLLQEQGGVCKICKRPSKNGRHLDVDHNHQTGAVRGLLCPSCNTAIGHFQERPAILLEVLRYLGYNNVEYKNCP